MNPDWSAQTVFMRKILLDLATTLDGFIEGPNGEIDWCIMDDDMDFNGFLSSIDTIFYGRISYDGWGNYQPPPDCTWIRKNNSGPQYIRKGNMSFHINPAMINMQPSSTENIVEQVNQIRQPDPGKISGSMAAPVLSKLLFDHNLIDQYRISVHPTVLGAGKPLFQNLKNRISLKLVAVNRFRSGVVQLIYDRTQPYQKIFKFENSY